METNPVQFEGLKYSTPSNYEIVVKSVIPKSFANRFGSMVIKTVNEEEGTTVLVGELRDQAALAGILNTLYEMHMPIISVKLD